MFIAPAQPPPSFFLFFSGAALASRLNSPPAAPLKNKKNSESSWFFYNMSPLRGFGPLARAGSGARARNPGGSHQSVPFNHPPENAGNDKRFNAG